MIKKIINYFNGFKLRNKLLLSYLFVILLPVASIGYFLINRTIANVMEHEEYTSRINGRQIAANISDKLDDLLALTSNIYYEDQLMDFLQTINPHSDTLQRYNEYKTQFDRYSKRFPINFGSLMKLSIYTTNTTILPDGYFIIHITDELASQDWFREACEAKGQSIFLEPFTKDDAARNIGGNRFLAIVRLLDPFSSSGVVNVLKLSQ